MWLRRILFLSYFLIFFLLPTNVYAEEIRDFTSQIVINESGTISAIETISYDFGSLDRHGIFRTIPTIKTNSQGKKFRLKISVTSVTDEQGKSYSFSTSKKNDDLQIKIGDPNRTITGLHTYELSYNVGGALTYFSDHDELYWNVTGNDWQIPIDHVSSTVRLPQTVSDDGVKEVCYTGASGSNESDCQALYRGQTFTFTSTNPLPSYSGMTIVAGWPKGMVAVLEPAEVINFSDTFLGKIVEIILSIVLAIVVFLWYIFYPLYLIYKWYQGGRDPETSLGVATAWFDPPKTQKGRTLTPGETGALVDETADFPDVAATIVDLARRGYIKIIETKKDEFALEKQKEDDDKLLPFEEELFAGIFKTGDRNNLKDASLTDTLEKTKEKIYEQLVTDGFFPENPDRVRTFYNVVAVFALVSLNIPLFLVALICGRNMPRKTLFGREQANIALSLKNFLSSQERELNFQAKNQMMFEKLLPYAVAFGVEKEWAKRFEGITLTQPTWYQGYNSGVFTAAIFVDSLNSSIGSVQTAATPTSSSSGFSSGFSGGSSGGGGGGGGGGSW